MKNYEVQIELLASNIDKISTPVLITGNIPFYKAAVVIGFCRKVRPYAWHHAIEGDRLNDKMAAKCPKLMFADELAKTIAEDIANGKEDSWKKEFDRHKYIVIEDFYKIAEKTTSQEILLDYLKNCNKPIIVTSKTLIGGNGYSDDVVEYFSEAAHLHVEDPTKEQILEDFFNGLDCLHKISLEDEAIAWIKQQEFFSIRTANGFRQTLKLHNTGKPFTLEECKKLSKGYIN